MVSRYPKWIAALAVLAAAFVLIAPDLADAKLGKSGGSGSRGSKTQAAPPATQTAPRTATPIQNSAAPRAAAPAAGAMAANATKPGLLGSMSKGGFMAGLLGAGALGMLLGYGMSGGLGGFGAILGLMLQVLLFAGVAMLLFTWWQRRKQQQEPAYARQNAPGDGYGQQPGAPLGGATPDQAPRSGSGLGAMGAMGVGAGAGAASGMFGNAQAEPQAPVPTRPLTLSGEDFGGFEKLLTDVHLAFAREDHNGLRQLCTEEMADYFAQDIAENVRNNKAVRISDVKLEQGDLSEAWKEPGAEYATVAMRFSLSEQMLDRRSPQPQHGATQDRSEVTEIWTFVRLPGGHPQDWRLSAIQDAG